jgi:hypothetical protein
MGRPRTDLQAIFETILGNTNAYYQPPPTLQMAYPCIVYDPDRMDSEFADNSPYVLTRRYLVTTITRDPDSSLPMQVASLPMCLMNRAYRANNLNHHVFILYF